MARVTRPPSPFHLAWLAALCAGWTSGAVGQSSEPLIEYRRADAANPLREQPAPVAPTQPAPNLPTAPAAAQATPESPPPQPVYRDANVQAAEFSPKTTEPARQPQIPAAAPPTPNVLLLDVVDPDAPARKLAPPSMHARPTATNDDPAHFSKLVPQALTKFTSLSTAGGGLAVVVGLYLVSMWLIRGSGGAKRTGSLPAEAFSVLGRAPLTAQSVAQLLRLGNKLVLVAVAADGAQPLAEVTDPAEVERIVGLCAKSAPHGPSAEFQQVLEQLSREPARGFLGREGSAARRRA